MNRKVPVLSAAVVLLLASMQTLALDLGGTLWESVAAKHGLDAALLYAIAVQETGRPMGNRTVAP
jgi:predicted enzyme involved in methoxymalonyl-ACP biosynthesis